MYVQELHTETHQSKEYRSDIMHKLHLPKLKVVNHWRFVTLLAGCVCPSSSSLVWRENTLGGDLWGSTSGKTHSRPDVLLTSIHREALGEPAAPPPSSFYRLLQ